MTAALRQAIHLREQTRRAIDRDEMGEVVRLNGLADAAYLELDPIEASLYLDWAFGRISVVEFNISNDPVPHGFSEFAFGLRDGGVN
jgi:hypothetical protein